MPYFIDYTTLSMNKKQTPLSLKKVISESLRTIEEKSLLLSYLPTPPLRQDMTQGQFLSGV